MCRPPDIKSDRIVVIEGGVAVHAPHTMFELADPAPVWVNLVPVEDRELESVYPYDRYVRILHDVRIGTVDELVADYRSKLERVWACLAETPEQMAGTVETLRRNNLDRDATCRPCTVDRRIIEARQKKRNEMLGFEPSQSGYERDVLMRLVAQYLDRKYMPNGEQDRCSSGLHQPAANPKAVQFLIDALTTFKQDIESCQRTQTDRQANEEKIDIPDTPILIEKTP